jgi:hypothetical protein
MGGAAKGVVGRLGQAWYEGWQRFAESAGGRAQDLVGGNPWRQETTGGRREAVGGDNRSPLGFRLPPTGSESSDEAA